MKILKIILPAAFLLLTVGHANDALKVIYGNVSCFNTFPVRGVEVTAKRSKQTVKTDSVGNFSIIVREKGDILNLKAKGFVALRHSVSRQDSVQLNMVLIESKKNQEMVTAYGYITKEELTYAMTNLSDDNNTFQNYIDIFDLLTGTVAGVSVSRQTSPPSVTIRGATSVMADTQPLFVLDGMPTDISVISGLRPMNIKSVSVIKDGEAAIYGVRGANGVIVIELKK